MVVLVVWHEEREGGGGFAGAGRAFFEDDLIIRWTSELYLVADPMRTPSWGPVGWSPILRTLDGQRSVGRSRTSRTCATRRLGA